MLTLGILAQHVLFVFLVVVAPVADYYDTRRLKNDPTSKRKVRYYATLCTWLWVATLIAMRAAGVRTLVTFTVGPGDARWLLGHAWVRYLVLAIVLLFALLMLQPYAIATWKRLKKQPRKYRGAELFKRFSYFLPQTRAERRWWVLVCVTAGICEEVLFRGFVLHYLHLGPWKLNLTLALFFSAVIFALQHLYQGAAGAVGSGVIGLTLALLFVLSGSLLLPIVLHAVMDLRMLVVLRPPAEEMAAAG